MKRVSLALYRPHDWFDIGGKAICLWTRSEFSHVELVVEGEGDVNDLCYSSSLRDGGVRRKRIDLFPAWWKVIDLPKVDPRNIVIFYDKTAGQPYGWRDLITQHVLRLPRQDDQGWLCSEWIAMALNLPRPEVWTPGMLDDWATKQSEMW